MGSNTWVTTVLIAICLAACGNHPTSEEVAAAITADIQAQSTPPGSRQSRDALQAIYGRRAGAPLWVGESLTGVGSALDVIRSSSAHGLRPEDYAEQAIASRADAVAKTKEPDVRELAALDVMVTAALLELGHDVAVGRVQPEQINRQWKSAREATDVATSLERAADGDLKGWLDSIKPKHRDYEVLQTELRRLTSVSGGSVQGSTTEAAGPSVAERIKLIALSLERWRWLPEDLGERSIIVNVPAFRLAVRDHGITPLTMKVVVGLPDKATPIFSGSMTTVVFSPYWNIPESIIEGEIAEKEARSPGYLQRNNIDILRVSKDGVEEVNPSRVDWGNADDLKGLSFRQRPGAQNALGHVKFLFPNAFSVYLHDTPADALFGRENRALSHGCVRVEHPEQLASLVLENDEEWTGERIREAMYSGVEKQVPLKRKLPVHIVYLTAWVDEATGRVQYSPDVYGFDEVQTKLDRKQPR